MVRPKIALAIALFMISAFSVNAAVIDPNDSGFDAKTREQNYNQLVDALFASGKATQAIGDKLWVPWFSTSSSCEVPDLQSGNACNAGTIDWTHNCMVTDEFSQVGILVAMGNNQQRMDQFYNTLGAIKSTFGDLPAWRVYRNGDSIEPCKDGINGNCDTASDATARIIMALYAASENPSFSGEAQARYKEKANSFAAAMVENEILQQCYDTAQGRICNWLAAGSHARNGGMGSWDFSYTGYYPDAIIAMLQACGQTGNGEYCAVADDLTRGYLLAAQWDGSSFKAPPGKAFRWEIQNGAPRAVCTNTCNPDMWDGHDASRALGLCEANYYGDLLGHELPGLKQYCQQWKDRYLGDPTRAPLQYYSSGDALNYQSGYFAQGLQALNLIGQGDAALTERALDSALAHYVPGKGTWDYSACFGVYTQAFPVRALGDAIGKMDASFSGVAAPPSTPAPEEAPDETPTIEPEACGMESVESLGTSCSTSKGSCVKVSDLTVGTCRTVQWTSPVGNLQALACEKSANTAEVYLQSYPQEGSFTLCVGDGCVRKNQGFDRFALEETCTASDSVPEPEPLPQEPVAAPSGGVGALAFSCEIQGGCAPKSDVTSGTCRTVLSGSSYGDLQMLACEKDGGAIEVYRQAYPAGVPFRACLGTGCVDEVSGFARIAP